MNNCTDFSQKILIWQTVVMFLTFFAALITTYLAWRIGKRQNEINERSLSIQDFVETFVMPQQVLAKDDKGNDYLAYYNLLVKNASSYPVYLNSFSLNGVFHSVGSSVLPTGTENWYAIPIPKNIQENGELILELNYEDYLKRKYQSNHKGVVENMTWQIRSEKSLHIKF